MKTFALFFALSFSVLTIPTHSATSSSSPVLDSDGDPLRPGEEYVISSTTWGAGEGEVKLGRLDSSKCPSDVIMTRVGNGDPITITPAAAAEDTAAVLPSTYQTFRFSVPTTRLCVNNVSWWVHNDESTGKYFLKAGQFVNNLSNLFRIEPFGRDYVISYCPFGAEKCYYVCRYFDTAVSSQRLVLCDDYPFFLLFKKVKKVSAV